jgi:hypothetical protein
MRDIRINEPGAGEWIMARVTGSFLPSHDHSFATYRDGRIVGGFAMCHYLGASATIHMAGDDEHWCSPDLLWMVFDYAFNQLGMRKLIAPVRSNNYLALSQDLRAGWFPEAIIRDAYPDAHMFILTLTRERCRWLKVKPKRWMTGEQARKLEAV